MAGGASDPLTLPHSCSGPRGRLYVELALSSHARVEHNAPPVSAERPQKSSPFQESLAIFDEIEIYVIKKFARMRWVGDVSYKYKLPRYSSTAQNLDPRSVMSLSSALEAQLSTSRLIIYEHQSTSFHSFSNSVSTLCRMSRFLHTQLTVFAVTVSWPVSPPPTQIMQARIRCEMTVYLWKFGSSCSCTVEAGTRSVLIP